MILGRRLLVATLCLFLFVPLYVTSVNASQSSRITRASKPTLHLIAAPYLTVGTDANYPPMEYVDPKHPHRYIGVDVDLANALARTMGLKGAKVVEASFDTLIPSLVNRREFDVIMAAMVDTAQRRKAGVSFVDYLRTVNAILVHKNSSIHANSYHGLCGHSVAVQSGTVQLFALQDANKHCKRAISIASYTDNVAAFQAFASGHVEAYTAQLPTALSLAKQHPGKFRQAGHPFAAGGYIGIALPQQERGLDQALTKALHKMQRNGKYQSILHKWGVDAMAIHK